jgi:antitoxin (DNA-binding transcriptional repressor) of toxin-antitoxin stability system
MKMVKRSDAKNNLSRHLEYVRRGGRIRILDRDTPVADLVPVHDSQSLDSDELLLASLERRGIVRRGKRGPMPRELMRPGPPDPKARVLATLVEERRNNR